MLFNPGTGTLKSVTVEAALVEAMVALQIAEEAARVTDATIPNAVGVNFFTGDKTVTLAIADFPLVRTNVAAGVAFKGINYFNAVPVPAFSNTGSDLLSTSLVQAVFELAQKLEIAELAAPVIDGKNISTSSIDTSNNLFAFQAELNVTMSQTPAGVTQFAVVSYLP